LEQSDDCGDIIINIAWKKIRESSRISGTEMPCHREGKMREMGWCNAHFTFVEKMHVVNKNTEA
jgi:hypothetical protein